MAPSHLIPLGQKLRFWPSLAFGLTSVTPPAWPPPVLHALLPDCVRKTQLYSSLKAPGTPDAGDDDDDSDIIKNRVHLASAPLPALPVVPCCPSLLAPVRRISSRLDGPGAQVPEGTARESPAMPTCTATAHRHSRHKLSAPEGGGGKPPRENLRRRRNDW